jgi:hypothetical protein
MPTPVDARSEEKSKIRPSRDTRKPLGALTVLLLLGASFVGVWLYNSIVANKPLQRILANDPRNAVVKEHAKFEGLLNVHVLVFDVDEVSGNATRMDVLRTFLQYAEAMKDQRFQKVVLACRGNKRFEMDGLYFQQLGKEFVVQNPFYTIRTLPINVTAMDGSHPYSEYEGGVLGVLSKEMEQFADFSDRWYSIDLAALPGAAK